MHFRAITRIVGLLVILFSGTMIIPGLVALIYRDGAGRAFTQHGPEQHHYQKPLTGFQFALLFAVRPPQYRANGEGDKKGLGKSAARSIPVDECYQPRDNHGP
ncbi:hypothetical protein AWG43_22605 [Escherichia coli]|nr:hypothetical protein AWF56_13200 [Escherichia coli]KZH45460.1 hypothetical protein AWG43_22605 [Escherichia coli]KZI71356.1 hypothetical protein AWG74_19925 [Escherichia coli]